jgi:hypothetical protein
MEQHLESLGERIVQAARLAVAMHLDQTAATGGQQGRLPDELRGSEWIGQSLRQRVMIGGADPRGE